MNRRPAERQDRRRRRGRVLVALSCAPWFAYPVFLMKALCFALFACAFNLLLGYAGLMCFGHAMFFGMAGYFCGHVVKVWGLPPELGLLAGVLARGAARPGDRRAGDPPPGHLLRHDHARLRADDLLLLRPGAVHRRRGRPAGHCRASRCCSA